MNKKLFYSALIALAIPVFTACNDDDDVKAPRYEAPYSLYILNEGSWGKNNASISAVDPKDINGHSVSDIYSAANSKGLGDVAQDLVYDDDTHCLFVSVSESKYIAKLDDRGRELVRYTTTAEQAQPRSLVLEDGFLYASLYGGMVAKFDTVSLSLVSTVKVGAYPEQMAEEDDMLAVCNSGYGEGNTLSIIDLRTFTVVKEVTLPHKNPQHIIACDDRFYCNTTEYDENWNSVSTIVEVNPKTGATKDITTGFYMAEGGDVVYIVEQATNYYTTPYSYTNTFKTYNPKTGKVGTDFLTPDIQKSLSDKGIYGITFEDDTKTMFICINQQEGAEYVNSLMIGYDARGNNIGQVNAGVLAKKVVVAD